MNRDNLNKNLEKILQISESFELPDDSGVISHFELPDDSGSENPPVHQDNEKRRDLPRRRRVW